MLLDVRDHEAPLRSREHTVSPGRGLVACRDEPEEVQVRGQHVGQGLGGQPPARGRRQWWGDSSECNPREEDGATARSARSSN